MALSKPVFTQCKHCTSGERCDIYSTKPLECTEYTCGWLDGEGTEADKPNRIHLVHNQMFDLMLGMPWLLIESQAGALATEPARRIIESKLRQHDCVITVSRILTFALYIPQGRSVPDDHLAQLRQRSWTIHDENAAMVAAE
ncbi:hypothetical protein A3B33_02510 [Candidatus Adlerbacteria bacterium RIFCSPLOWO2_01_FULL_54_16]|uniref:Uncharacterized protein n=1 Tax=Candidatus Adlerbacteria bacterium RIFCSPLOWO2_01_FULL_54_16 TaxID=1797244 RepID=A0A1F4Y129_9BACT|nr:MAG: hypothetical protein A3B33_02510 [Candidatus Adlerbacteria bacterium RIFCSPLOWO2_01_FULL_54_16]